MTSDSRVALVVGAGPGLGGAVARRFAREGYVACVVRRKGDELDPLCAEIRAQGGQALAFGVDARDEDDLVGLFERIEGEVGPVEVAVHNVGANVSFPIREMTARVYSKVWQMACFSGFLVGREAARRMVPRGSGTILFTGATASLRGRSGMAAFAGAKAALRALAQSMARELGPEGHPRSTRDRRWCDRHAVDPRELPANCRGTRRGGAPESRRHRRELLAASHSAAECLDSRAGPASAHRALVTRPDLATRGETT